MKATLQLRHIHICCCLFLCLAVVGCLLITKTFTIVFYIEDPIISTDVEIHSARVNLEGNDIWEDHKDDIKSIDGVEFAVKMTNRSNAEATGQVYVSDTGSLASHSAIQNNATLVLDGIDIPPHETEVIDRQRSLAYLRNFEEFKRHVETGSFYVYAIAENVPFHVEVSESLAVIVSFTAGPGD